MTRPGEDHTDQPPQQTPQGRTLDFGGRAGRASPVPAIALGFGVAALGLCLLSLLLVTIAYPAFLLTAFMAGLFSLVALAVSLAAAIDHRTNPTGDDSRVRGRITLACWLGGIVLVVLFFAVPPQMGRAREPAKMMGCENNLRQIAMILQQYQSDHPDQGLPPTLDDPDLYYLCICPSGSELPSRGPLVYGQNLSYFYVGAGLVDGGPNDIVMLEPLKNHRFSRRNHMNILFADGTVRRFTEDDPALPGLIQGLIDSGRVPPGTDMSQFLPPGR